MNSKSNFLTLLFSFFLLSLLSTVEAKGCCV